jgi:hypothetical protein
VVELKLYSVSLLAEALIVKEEGFAGRVVVQEHSQELVLVVVSKLGVKSKVTSRNLLRR